GYAYANGACVLGSNEVRMAPGANAERCSNALFPHTPPPPGKILPGYKGAKYVGVRNGRHTWSYDGKCLQWQGGEGGRVEVYRKSDGSHLGETDINGNPTKDPDPSRNFRDC